MAEEVERTESQKLDDLIDDSYALLETSESVDERLKLIAELRAYLELRERYYNPNAISAKERELELAEEKRETEIRRREIMEEEHKLAKRRSNIEVACSVSQAVSNIGLGVTDRVMHASDVNKALTVESGGCFTTPFAKSWEQSLAKNRI